MLTHAVVLVIACLTEGSAGFGGADGLVEGLFKKYGMMKIFEDCYGKETVQAWWEEMAEAIRKCRGMPSDSLAVEDDEDNFIVKTKVQQAEELLRKQAEEMRKHAEEIRRKIAQTAKKPQPIDLGDRNDIYPSFIPQAQLYPQVPPLRVQVQDSFHVRPQSSSVHHPFYYLMPTQSNFYYSIHSGIDGPRRQVRGLDIEAAKQILQSRIDEKVGNISCILRELNFLDAENQADVNGIHARIRDLSIPDDIKKDMIDGVNICNDFSKCVPLTKYERQPVLRTLARPYMFFNCFKTQKLMACMKKDFREQYGVTIDDSNFPQQRNSFSSLVNQSDEEAEVSIFSMIFGFADQDA